MENMDKTSRIHKLVQLLNRASREYYGGGKEIMPDFEYDGLYDELVALESETGVIFPDSPTQNVGYKVVSALEKHVHEQKMLSLDKTKETGKLENFLSIGQGLLSWKLDGLTVVLSYDDGKLSFAATRGNGETGELITHNAKTFKNLPPEINFKAPLMLRGEALISYPDFEKINETITDETEKYKNPRNLTSGTVRQLNSRVCAERKVNFFAFSLVRAEGMDFKLKSEQLEWLKSLGFSVTEYVKVDKSSVTAAVEAFKNRIGENPYPSDGLVLTYDDITLSESLGQTSKFPRDAVAFKWEDEQAETVLREIKWNTSRTGLVNPVAVFDPVELLGTTVNKASVHNVSIIESLKLGIGDRLLVYKANMIIPQIAENMTRSGGAQIPADCPECGFETEIAEQNGVKSLYCTNPNCRAQLVRALTHYCHRDAMNIEGLSIQTIEKFAGLGFLSSYTDIYELGKYETEILALDGFGKKSYDKLIAAIEKSKDCELANFIYALGINHIGLSSAKLLCRKFDYDLNAIRSADEEDLITIDGFGAIMSHAVKKYFSDEKNYSLIDRVLCHLRLKRPETAVDRDAVLNGLTFVITGTLEGYANRDELASKIESLGGKTSSSVSSKTSFLINNDSESGSSKNKKAKELNIPIITQKEFSERFL